MGAAGLNAFSRELLSAHLHPCAARDIRAGKDESLKAAVTDQGCAVTDIR